MGNQKEKKNAKKRKANTQDELVSEETNKKQKVLSVAVRPKLTRQQKPSLLQQVIKRGKFVQGRGDLRKILLKRVGN